jgi:hypothetical protein
MRNLLLFSCLACVSFSQTQTRVVGEVTGKSDAEITIKTDGGQLVAVPVNTQTKVLRVPPGQTSLTNATAITLNDVSAGDRVLARNDQVIVMSRSDLQQKQAADAAEWQKRGSAGRVTAVTANALTLTTAGGQTVRVDITPKTTFRRYSPESVRFADARPSSLAEIGVGDQIRVLGDLSGEALSAEAIVSGSFRNFAGTVAAVNGAAGEITVTDLETKAPVTVKISATSNLRRLPPMMAQAISQRLNGAPAAPADPASSRSRTVGEPGPVAAGGPRDLGQMMDRMPVLTLADLKPGDAVIVAASAGLDNSRASAIAVLAGVEPLLTGPATDRRLSGPWSLDINMAP